MRLGQATIEFLAGMMLFLIVLVSALTLMSSNIPDLKKDLAVSERNMEIYSATEKILSSPGYHSNASGGKDWQNNVNYTEEFGLAEDYLILNKDKIDAISTTGVSKFNYTQFKQVSSLENKYYFNFTWFPIVKTSKSFVKESSPSKITEPNDSLYTLAQDRVHYGTIKVSDQKYRFLVTAHNGVYNTTWKSKNNWNFEKSQPLGEKNQAEMASKNFTVYNFQNRKRKPGASIILERHIKSFGANPNNVDQSITKLNRFGVLKASNTDKQPVRIEVLSW